MHEVSQLDAQNSIRSVLVWYRRRITTNRFGKRFLPVPAVLAGWVLAGPGELSEPDGGRPLGAVRDLLIELVDAAEIDSRERFVVCAAFGLTEYPGSAPVSRLRRRVPMVRERDGDGVSERQLRHITTRAVRALDAVSADRSVCRPGERPVTGPCRARRRCAHSRVVHIPGAA